MLRLRRLHPALRPASWTEGADGDGDGVPDIAWYDQTGSPPAEGFWYDAYAPIIGWRIDADEALAQPRSTLADETRSILVFWNRGEEQLRVPLPTPQGRSRWRMADTAAWLEGDANSHAFDNPPEMPARTTTCTAAAWAYGSSAERPRRARRGRVRPRPALLGRRLPAAVDGRGLAPLELFGRADAQAWLVGNTRALWPRFVGAYAADASLQDAADPLDTYVERALRRALEGARCAIASHTTPTRASWTCSARQRRAASRSAARRTSRCTPSGARGSRSAAS